jgi:signal peptidase I
MTKIKRLIIGLLFSVLTLAFSISVYAEELEKTIEIELNKEYVQCTFYVSFEKEKCDNVTLITPNRKEYTFTQDSINEERLKCTIKNTVIGKYKVIVKKEIDSSDVTENDGAAQDSSDEEIQISDADSSSEADREIGKVTVSVQADEETTEAITDNLKLTKEIDGLKIYWIDDDIAIDWTDTTVGKVNISVFDSGNLKILGSEKVDGNSYRCPVDQSIKQITVKIVPAESTNVNGAGDEFIVDVDNHPDGEILIEPFEYVNTDTIPAVANLNESYSLLFTNNGEVVGQTDVLQPGSHDIEVPTVIGENNVKIYIVDDAGNMRSTSVSFIKDIEPPIIKIEDDINGLATYDEMVEFNGIVTDFDTLVFRNQEVEVDWDGSFNIQASLKDGPNELELIATDLAGNQTTYTAVVTKLVVEKTEVPWKTIIFTGIAVLILIILFIIKKRGFHLSNVIPDSGENPARKYHRPTSFTDYFCFFICLIVVIIFVYVIFNISFVTSGSMEPTIKERELTITNRLAYTVKDPGRGDIVICRAGDQNELMLKRIIGLPNDEISFVDGYVFINGVICDESAYLKSDVETNCTESFTVPEGCYFLLGDNRENSIDSRHWNNTFVKRENLIGKIIFHINFNS